MMAEGEETALEERLKAALWFSIGKIVDEETLKLGVNATPQFIGALTEMVWSQIENTSQDLESFSNHAGRQTISTDDVMLLTRRNEGLEAVLRSFLDNLEASKPKGGWMPSKPKGEVGCLKFYWDEDWDIVTLKSEY